MSSDAFHFDQQHRHQLDEYMVEILLVGWPEALPYPRLRVVENQQLRQWSNEYHLAILLGLGKGLFWHVPSLQKTQGRLLSSHPLVPYHAYHSH